ncbi:MAG TPA: hypothetical protein VMG37_24430 [Solirubrobacteraceae bacterium]|nr:hypothetical protein [Solirubrobacteraceae bacterium]
MFRSTNSDNSIATALSEAMCASFMRSILSPKMSAQTSSIGPPTLPSTSPFSEIVSSPTLRQYQSPAALSSGD